jgi:hypothetical protein
MTDLDVAKASEAATVCAPKETLYAPKEIGSLGACATTSRNGPHVGAVGSAGSDAS